MTIFLSLIEIMVYKFNTLWLTVIVSFKKNNGMVKPFLLIIMMDDFTCPNLHNIENIDKYPLSYYLRILPYKKYNVATTIKMPVSLFLNIFKQL